MTVTTTVSMTTEPPADHVVVAIDDRQVAVPKGTLIIRAAELVGVEIPRFCDHPLLEPVAACRACLVEIEGQPKPQPACAIPVTDGMRVHTAGSSPVAEKAQRGVLEFLLINHPLDCPICDKGGECPLQNQAMSHGPDESRFTGTKRTFPKPVSLSTQILLDRERCVSCARCTRFAAQIAGDPFITLQQRGARQIVAISDDTPFNSYFSGNTVQICPVGALTSAAYRFRARPFDLVSTPTVCEHCASGCALRTDVRRSTVMRRLAWEDAKVNEDWNCDKGRFAFPYLSMDRLAEPTVAGEVVSWTVALRAAADGIASAQEAGTPATVLIGGKLTLEDAYAYAKFARLVLNTDSVDFRIRRNSAEEADFLRTVVAGSGLGVTYADIAAAPAVLLVGFEPEEESPIVFLRLRKAQRQRGTAIFTLAPLASAGSAKLAARVLATAPGTEASVLKAIVARRTKAVGEVASALGQPGAIILVGERAADATGALSAAVALAEQTGARLAWIPRRAGERAALEAGLLPGLLPWGRPLSDPNARGQVEGTWDADLGQLSPGTATGTGSVATAGVLVLAGVDHTDLPDPTDFLAQVDAAHFVIALETRTTEVCKRADVVFPVAALTEKSGTFLNWEGRARPFAQVLPNATTVTDARVLGLLARQLGVPFGGIEVADLRRELAELGRWQGPRETLVAPSTSRKPRVPAGKAILASWRQLLDLGGSQAGEPALAGTARPSLVRLSAATAAGIGAGEGDLVTVTGPRGGLALPLAVTEMADGVVWLPANSAGSQLNLMLGATPGELVSISLTSGPATVSAGGAQ